MRPFFEQCVGSYLTLIKKGINTLKLATRPFLDEPEVETSSDNKEVLLRSTYCM